jgi:hypothetical protein
MMVCHFTVCAAAGDATAEAKSALAVAAASQMARAPSFHESHGVLPILIEAPSKCTGENPMRLALFQPAMRFVARARHNCAIIGTVTLILRDAPFGRSSG